MIDSILDITPYIVAVPAGLLFLAWLDEKGWM